MLRKSTRISLFRNTKGQQLPSYDSRYKRVSPLFKHVPNIIPLANPNDKANSKLRKWEVSLYFLWKKGKMVWIQREVKNENKIIHLPWAYTLYLKSWTWMRSKMMMNSDEIQNDESIYSLTSCIWKKTNTRNHISIFPSPLSKGHAKVISKWNLIETKLVSKPLIVIQFWWKSWRNICYRCTQTSCWAKAFWFKAISFFWNMIQWNTFLNMQNAQHYDKEIKHVKCFQVFLQKLECKVRQFSFYCSLPSPIR